MRDRKRQVTIFALFLSLFLCMLLLFPSLGLAQVLRGQILNQAGTPVGGYPVKIQSVDVPSKSIAAVTDNHGNFAVYGLSPGMYRVIPVNQPPGLMKEIEVRPGQDAVVTIRF